MEQGSIEESYARMAKHASGIAQKTIPQQFEELKIKLMHKEEQIKCLNEVVLSMLEDHKTMQASIRMLQDSVIRINEDRIKAIERELGTKPAEPATPDQFEALRPFTW